MSNPANTDEMQARLMRHIPTEFPEGEWLTAADTLVFINSRVGSISDKWLILIPSHLTKLIWDCPHLVEADDTVHYLWDLGYGRGDAIRLQDGKWLVIYQDSDSQSNNKKFYCAIS